MPAVILEIAQQIYFTIVSLDLSSKTKALSKKLYFNAKLVCYFVPLVKFPTIRTAGILIGNWGCTKYYIIFYKHWV